MKWLKESEKMNSKQKKDTMKEIVIVKSQQAKKDYLGKRVVQTTQNMILIDEKYVNAEECRGRVKYI